jgi:hypothetical protein
MVVYAGHPLVGRVVPVVRRYGQCREGQWIIELPDGSRQYLPAVWCSPLASSREALTVPPPPQDGPPPHGAAPSPLSLTALRDLAALVRHLREASGQRGEEQDDARRAAREASSQGYARGRGAQPSGATEQAGGIADLGELPAGESATAGHGDPASGPPAGRDPVGELPLDDVRQP